MKHTYWFISYYEVMPPSFGVIKSTVSNKHPFDEVKAWRDLEATEEYGFSEYRIISFQEITKEEVDLFLKHNLQKDTCAT